MLWQKNADQPRAIASLTKIVTALVVVERSALDSVVTASPDAEQVGANDPLVTELELVAGEKLTVEHLLYGLLLPSANDAAVALAEHVGGSQVRFAKMMTEHAAKLGAKSSRFTNPAGFDHPEHVSTAADMALLARKLLDDPVLGRIVATPSYQIPRAGGAHRVENRNLLLGAYEGANGVKTGQTRASGRSLVSSARRGDEMRVAVVLSSSDPVADSRRLLDHGFRDFFREDLLTKGRAWGVVTRGDGASFAVSPSRTFRPLVPAGEESSMVSFEVSRRRFEIVTPLGAKVHVPARLRCLGPGGGCKGREGMTLLERLLGVAGNLVR